MVKLNSLRNPLMRALIAGLALMTLIASASILMPLAESSSNVWIVETGGSSNGVERWAKVFKTGGTPFTLYVHDVQFIQNGKQICRVKDGDYNQPVPAYKSGYLPMIEGYGIWMSVNSYLKDGGFGHYQLASVNFIDCMPNKELPVTIVIPIYTPNQNSMLMEERPELKITITIPPVSNPSKDLNEGVERTIPKR